MTTTKKTTTAKPTTCNDQYVIVVLPKDRFGDGSTIRLIHELSLTEALSLLRAIKNKEVNKAPYKTYFEPEDQIGTLCLIKGTVQKLQDDLDSVLVDGDEFKLIDKEATYNMIIGVN